MQGAQPWEDSEMRNPRTDPLKGDVLEHPSGEKRMVLARYVENSTVHYREGSIVAECSNEQWTEWAKPTSIVDFG